MKASVRLNNDLDVETFVALAVTAERAGFDQVWLSHDLFWRSAPVMLAAAAVATERIALGIGIANPYSAHPAEIAMHAATLQELTGGRFLLGLGAGAEEFLGWAGMFPNLTDGDWLYGGEPETIRQTIAKGRNGVMPPFASTIDGKLAAKAA